MTTETEVCNLALLRAGQDTISSLTEPSRSAQLCSILFAQCRDAMLREFPWNFARRRVSLALLEDVPPTNWEMAYALPTDCLQALAVVVPGLRFPRVSQKAPFEVSSNGTQRVLFTDQEEAELIYTARVESISMWDPLAVSALAWLLCSELAVPLALKPEQGQNARNAYLQAKNLAASQSLNEGFEGVEPLGDILSGRGYGG